ncbi:sulfatase [Planctomycetaceae bacterium SCGC AG-212-D15]|nr:sulfatase [Planctomycetaceae bacterium SCGC AG-212-D15]
MLTTHARLCLRIIVLALGVFAPFLETTADAADKRKPNIIILLADDLGYADLGFQGCKDIPTPNLDGLAKSGVRCTNGYVSGPYCSPTRAGLMTGRYQTRFGHEFNPGGGKNDKIGLPLSETTIADRLSAAGYATGWVGKWHLGEAAKFRPQNRGFRETFGFLGGAHAYFHGKGAAPIFRAAEEVPEKEYLTDAFAREAIGFIDRHKAEPFFLYLAFNAVHTPLQATDDRLKKFDIADKTRHTYAAMTLAMDEAVGKVLDKVKAEKLEDDTLIFFFSDNGGPTMRGTTINGSRNTPLRGSKRTTLEGGIRVPFVVSWKNRLPAGKTYESPVIQLDILPTALAAAGVQVKPEWKLDGENLLPFLDGKNAATPHDTLYWRLGTQMAIRQGDWKLVRYDAVADGGKAGVTPLKLYNLAEDIGEANDLAAKEAEKAKSLEAAWDKWSAEQAKPLWGGGPKGSSEEEE